MEKVFLRVYNREIESMIEGGQLEEAITHCKHILKTYSMYIETYKLLGKSFLEARRYADAADIFQRVLMAVPDDFVSHVGMSIIRDDENKMDESIWHMERAFEVQPSNSAIQGELKRLYGKRDGVEPGKIRLSRDALANMYSQGELFNQAIAEIRSVLADDPDRPDLQVMLTRAYFRSGQKVEAAEMASTLLKKYPYCMDALRVLVDVLPGTARADNTQVFRHRLEMLDPYSNFAADSVFATEQVPDSAISLERLDYKPGGMPGTPQPDWSSTLGIQMKPETKPAAAPGWVQPSAPAEKPITTAAKPPEPKPDQPQPATDDNIPDWMRSAGWTEPSSAGSTDVPNAVAAQKEPNEGIAKAEIPDWLLSMAPAEALNDEGNQAGEPEEPLASSGDGVPDWLKSAKPAAAGSIPTAEFRPENTPQADNHSVAGGGIPPEASITPEEESKPEPSEPAVPMNENKGTIPEWLNAIAPAGNAEEPAGEPAKPAAQESNAAETGQTQSDLESRSEKPAPVEPVSLRPTEPLAETTDDIPNWLKSIAPKTERVEPEASLQPGIETAPLSRQDILEDRLSSSEGGASSEVKSGLSPESSKSTQEEPEMAIPEEPVAENTPSQDQGTAEWLAGLKAKAAAASAAPSNLAGMAGTGESMPATPTAEVKVSSQQSERAPDILENAESGDFQPKGEVKPLNIGDDALGWLESLAARQGAKPEELLTNPNDRAVDMPDWLRGSGEVEKKPEAPAPIPGTASPVPAPIQNMAETMPLGPLDEVPGEAAGKTSTENILEKPESIETIPPAASIPSPVDKLEEGKEDSLAWLEDLRSSSAPELPEAVETTEPNPDALEGSGVTEPGGSITPPASSVEEMPGWLSEEPKNEEKPAVEPVEELHPEPAAPKIPENDITITSWLNRKDVEEALGKKSAGLTGETDEARPTEELPDWLKDLEKPAKPIEPAKPEQELPDWLKPPAPAEGPESTSKNEAPAWLDENTQAAGESGPTLPEEWIPVERKPEATSGSLSPAEQAVLDEKGQLEKEARAKEEPQPAQTRSFEEPISYSVNPPSLPPTLKQTGMLSTVPPQDKDAALLSDAQTVLDQNSLDESMKLYSKLIKKGRLLDEVIHDLREGIYRYPVDVIIWQTLGDAYMRSNRLQDALDAYTKAEELLR